MRTFAQALRADAAQRIRKLNRHRRYHRLLDRPRVWPGNMAGLCRRAYLKPDTVIDGWCASLAYPDSAEACVSAWSRLNQLRDH